MLQLALLIFFLLVFLVNIFNEDGKPAERKEEFEGIVSELSNHPRFGKFMRKRKNNSFTIEMPHKRIRCEKQLDSYIVTVINGDTIVPINELPVERKKDMFYLLDILVK